MSAVFTILTMVAKEFFFLFSEMAPFLLLGFLLAGILHVWVPNRLYVPKISKPNFKSVLWAALFGVPLPICSCGVIPTAIALRKEGASKGASVSFLISTPATGVDSIMATYSILGGPFAVVRPIVAFLTALIGGMFTNLATRGESENARVHDETIDFDDCDTEHHCGCGHCDPSTNSGIDCCEHEHHDHCECGDGHCGCESRDVRQMTFGQKVVETFRYGFVNMVADMSKWLLIGLLLGALIYVFVPDDMFLFLRDNPLLCMLVVLVVAMPMYTCATGSIPLALAFVEKGITPGAALVLLMAGPATSIASMLVVGKAFGKRTLFAYIASIALGALAFGFIMDTFFMDTFLSYMLQPKYLSEELDNYSCQNMFFAVMNSAKTYLCAMVLGVLMVYSMVIRRFFHKSHCGCGHNHEGHAEHDCHESGCHCHEGHEHGEPVALTYRVNGMSCSHCKACVEKAVRGLDDVLFAEADVDRKELLVKWHDEDDVDEAALMTAVEEAGFEFGGKI